MAVGTYVREKLAFGLGDRATGKELADLIDTHASGTLSGRAKQTLRDAFASNADANEFITQVQNAANLTAAQTDNLGHGITDRRAASLIRTEMLIKAISVNDSLTLTENIAATRT